LRCMPALVLVAVGWGRSARLKRIRQSAGDGQDVRAWSAEERASEANRWRRELRTETPAPERRQRRRAADEVGLAELAKRPAGCRGSAKRAG